MSEWRPISTAEKIHDKKVWLWDKVYGPEVGHWFQRDPNVGWWAIHCLPVDPSYWMPIPPLPEPPAKVEELPYA